jgi:hypothetical protein
MSYNPIEHISSLRIGTVEFVSPDEIKVEIDLESPGGMAANAGIPRAFPRVNSYVLISSEDGYLVGQIEWIAIEKSPFPKRKGFQEYGLVDLPFPLRKMRVNPLGILKNVNNNNYKFLRGVQSFPSVGEPVYIPTDSQLKAIVESGEKRRVKIGTSPLASNADVYVDPDRLFGRHLAVLGNTGSGKSCSVAGLIQWSLEALKSNNGNPNARFIILDPNGEYSKVFKNKARMFHVNGVDNPLQVPLWFWNSSEWCSFMQASTKAQVPLLKKALRAMRNEKFDVEDDIKIEVKRFVGDILQSTIMSKNAGEPYKQFPHVRNFTERLVAWKQSIDTYTIKMNMVNIELTEISNELERLISTHRIPVKNKDYINYSVYTVDEMGSLIDKLRHLFETLGGSEKDLLPKNEDIPIKFSGGALINFLEMLAHETGSDQHLEFLFTRIHTMLSDTNMKPIIGDDIDITLEEWFNKYIGSDNEEQQYVTILDLSLVPTEIIHITTAVIARMVFEALQRYRKLEGKSLPTVIAMEEAHTFIKRYKEDSDNYNAS